MTAAASLPARLAALALAGPDEAAVAAPGGAGLSRGELAARVDAVATGLAANLGAGPGAVGVLGTGPELVVGMLAVLRAGRPALALDPALPDPVLRALHEHAGLVLVVADRPHGARAWATFGFGASLVTARLARTPGPVLPPPSAITPTMPAVLVPRVDAGGQVTVTALDHATVLADAEALAAGLGLDAGTHVAGHLRLSSRRGFATAAAALAAGGAFTPLAPPGPGAAPGVTGDPDVLVTTALLLPRLGVGPATRVVTVEELALGPGPVPPPTEGHDGAEGADAAEGVPPPPAAPAGDDAVALVGVLVGELLGTGPAGPDVDFFDAGGYSLLAARLLVRLEEQTGRRLPMSVFLDGATPAALGAALAASAAGEGPTGPLVTLQAGDPGRPVLVVAHDLQGSAWGFSHLARALGPDQPVLALESPLLEGVAGPATVEDLAEGYVAALRAAGPGPYHLCGYSFGGILAFEMARRLRAGGDEVALLAVVDVGPGYRGLDYSRTTVPPWPYLADVLDAPGRLPAPVRRVRLDPRVLRRRWARDLARTGRVRADQRLWWAWWRHWSMVGPSWGPHPYDRRIDVVWARRTAATDDTLGWAGVAPEVVVHRAGAHHATLMEPPEVEEVAAVLRDLLDALVPGEG